MRRTLFSLVLAVPALCPTAHAQITSRLTQNSFSAETFRPTITRGEIDVLSRILKLAPADRSALVALFEAHDAEVRGEGLEVRERCRDLAEEAELFQRLPTQAKVRDETNKWKKRKEELEKQFLADLTAMLTKEQEAQWPIVERELRRPRMLETSWMSGEGVDIIAMLAAVDPAAAESPKVLEALDRYATEIDAALKQRDAFIKAHEEEMGDLLKSDPQKCLAYRKDSVRNRVRVREINRRYAGLVAAELAEASRKKFNDRFLTESVNWWNRETPAERFIKAAAAVGGLTKEKQAEAQAMMKEYTGKVEELTRRTVSEYQSWEEKRVPTSIRVALGEVPEDPKRDRMLGENSEAADDSPLGKVRVERLRIDREFRGKMKAILSEEQRATINETYEEGTRFFGLDDQPRL